MDSRGRGREKKRGIRSYMGDVTGRGRLITLLRLRHSLSSRPPNDMLHPPIREIETLAASQARRSSEALQLVAETHASRLRREWPYLSGTLGVGGTLLEPVRAPPVYVPEFGEHPSPSSRGRSSTPKEMRRYGESLSQHPRMSLGSF